MEQKNYHYTECGLDNVYIEGLAMVDDSGEEIIIVPNIQLLHWQIAQNIISSESLLHADEIRFLRSEMGLSWVKFAKKLAVTVALVEKWEESDEEGISKAMDDKLRAIALPVLFEKIHDCYKYRLKKLKDRLKKKELEKEEQDFLEKEHGFLEKEQNALEKEMQDHLENPAKDPVTITHERPINIKVDSSGSYAMAA